MGETPLTRERILEAAEDVLRRYGPAKATVVDVAQALGVSHGSVYRHFASKATLRDAVLRIWLERVSGPLHAIADSRVAPPERLRQWLSALREAKRAKVAGDPELFATYSALAAEARDVIDDHVEHLMAQLEFIVEAGVASGDFRPVDPRVTATAVLDATARFHHPAMAQHWSGAGEDAAFETVLALVLQGLLAHPRDAARG